MAKDKQAARAKAKRRAAKIKEEHQAAERLLHDVHEEQKSAVLSRLKYRVWNYSECTTKAPEMPLYRLSCMV